MKIAILGSAHPLRGGGIATFNERMADALQQEGHEVNIISFYLQYPSLLFPGKNQFTDEPPPKDLKIKSLINSISPLNWWRVGAQLNEEHFDLIIVRYWIPFMGPSLGTILRLSKKNKHTKVIAIIDNLIPHEKRIGDRAFTKYFLGPIDGVVTMSREVLKDVRAATNKPSSYSPHPLYDNYGPRIPKEQAREKLGIPIHKKVVLFFGFIRKYKGLDILLEAMTQINDPEIHLVVAGEFYDKEEDYQSFINQLSAQHRISLFTSFIPNNEVGLYFSAADVVAQPYRSATQSGISQICYHFEVPMIVSNVGGLPEIVPDGKVGLIAEPNAASFSEKIKDFFSLNTDWQEGIRIEKEKYSWQSFLNSLFNLYNGLKD